MGGGLQVEDVLKEFEDEVEELRAALRAGRASGTDDQRSLEQAESLVREYRAMLRAEPQPSRGRELLERFRKEAARL